MFQGQRNRIPVPGRNHRPNQTEWTYNQAQHEGFAG